MQKSEVSGGPNSGCQACKASAFTNQAISPKACSEALLFRTEVTLELTVLEWGRLQGTHAHRKIPDGWGEGGADRAPLFGDYRTCLPSHFLSPLGPLTAHSLPPWPGSQWWTSWGNYSPAPHWEILVFPVPPSSPESLLSPVPTENVFH